MRFEELKELDITDIEDINLFRIYVNYLLSVSRTKEPEEALELIEHAINKSKKLNDEKSLAVIYYIKFILIFGFEETITEVNNLSEKVKIISRVFVIARNPHSNKLSRKYRIRETLLT